MATPHIESKENEIAPIVLMPGDPLRAKYIAEKYLTNVQLVNCVRNVFAYTGDYKDKKITVFASGMGIPSAGIYIYELFQFYHVEKIIRIGSCGSMDQNVKVGDVVLAASSYSYSSFPKMFLNEECRMVESSAYLNQLTIKTASELKNKIHQGPIITSDIFDLYTQVPSFRDLFPKEIPFLAAEMEAFVLFYLAKFFKKEATCLLTVVDSIYETVEISSEDREKQLDEMILLALETINKI